MSVYPAYSLKNRDSDNQISNGVRCPGCCRENTVIFNGGPKKTKQLGALMQHCICNRCGFVWTLILELRYWTSGRVSQWSGVDWLKREEK